MSAFTEAQDLPTGSLISMMGGVVRVDRVEDSPEDPINFVRIFVSIGNLNQHPMTFPRHSNFDVVKMPEDLQPWYGV